MSIANFEQLKDITQDLWRKAKAKIEAVANDYVSKTLPNNVIGETIFKDGYIEGGILSHFNNKNTQMYNAENGGCFGIPSTSISAGIKVGKIAIAVKDDLAVGSTVSNVVALAVRKSNNEVKESILQNGTATVFQNQYSTINAQKIAYININKTFDEEVYFVIGCTNMLWNTDTPPNRANVYGSSTIPAVGTVLGIQNYHYSGRIIVFSERMSFSEVINIKNNSVSKIKDNILTGKTILQNGCIDGELYSYNNPNATGAATGNGIYSGTNNKVIQSNQSVTSVIIAVDDAFALGSTVTGVNIGVVRRDNNQVMEYIIQNGTSTVIENNYPQSITATKVINVLVNKKWTEDVYLLIGANGMLWGRVRGTSGVTTATGGNSLPSVGSTINNLNESNYIGRVVALGSNISLNTLTSKVDVSDVANAANKIPRILPNGKLDPSILPAEQNGGVRTVNDRSPDSNGNVTVLAEHIKYTSGNAMNLKAAIDGKPNTVNGQRLNPSNGDIVLTGEHIKYVNGQDRTIKQAIDGKPNTVNGQSQTNGNITIYSDNISINSSTSKTIKQALDEVVQKDQNNNFTKKNDFNFYAPTVTKSFTRMSFNDNSRLVNRTYELYNNSSAEYFVTLSDKFEDTGLTVNYLLLPIKNSQVGDRVSATWFVLRDNRSIHTNAGYFQNYTVEDIDMVGCKCIRIPVNVRYTEKVMFGFAVQTRSVNGRTIGMAYANDLSYSKEVWTGRSPNQLTSFTNNSAKKVFPYKILYNTTSEVVTRFELENVTQMYPKTLVGEMKQLSYDAGNSLEDGMNTWLRANGQAINSNDYPELYEKFNTSRTDDDIEVTIPSIDSQVGYYYICAK